jgi:two-component system sensor histidine kinase LytS
MAKFDSLIDNKIAQNLFIWFFFFLILLTTIQGGSRVVTSFFAILLLAPAVYVNSLFILPFFRKKTIVFFALFIANSIVFAVVSVFLIKIVTNDKLELRMFVNFLGIMILTLVFASSIKIARDSFVLRQQENEAELKLLKAQLNPHFLFNTLNNLYGLSVIKSSRLPNLMLKLSDLLRYSLYETKETYVPLKKEIQYLENYMALEKIRLEDTTEITFTKQGALDSVVIAPMLLIVFVENSFKHLSNLQDTKREVSVLIKEENNQLTFICKNTIDTSKAEEISLEKGRSGIGLVNAKKRLALMYQEKHKLTIKENRNSYKIELILDL